MTLCSKCMAFCKCHAFTTQSHIFHFISKKNITVYTANANVRKMEFFRTSPEHFRIILVWHSVRVFVGMYPFIFLESIGQFTYYMHKVHCTQDNIVVNPAIKYLGQFHVRKTSWVIHCDMTLSQKISEITFAVHRPALCQYFVDKCRIM